MAARKPLVLVDGETQQLQAADWVDLSDDINLTVSSPITLTDDDIGLDETAVDHDNLLNFVATKHFDTTSLSAGSVVISNGTTFIEDNVGLFFDTTSNRLGIGSSSPQKNLHILHVTPTIRISDSNASTDQEVTGLIEFYRGNTTNRVGYVAMTSFANDILALATDYADGEIRLRTGNAVDRLIIDKDGDVSILGNVVINGQLGLNITPTARITLPAGTATAGTAPLKLTTGISLTSPEVGAIEFTTDSIYFTITTGAARKYVALTEGLTSGQVTFATTNGRLTDAAALTWDGTTLLTTRVAVNTSGQSVTFTAYYGANSDGRNIWIGGGGLSSLGAIGQTYKGAKNVSVGVNALYSNTIGYNNTAIGYYALAINTSGANNIAIGASALVANVGGSGNVAIGSSAGFYETGSNKLFIDNAARASEADGRVKALIYGVFSATAVDQDLVINGQLGLNITPTAWVTLPAGTTVAGTAPIKLTTGTSLTAAEAGTVEFTTDDLFFTITTGAARKEIALSEGLTSGRVTYATTNGRLIDDADLTFDGATLGSKSFEIPATTSSVLGTIIQGGTAFIHSWAHPTADGDNFFMGLGSGNFTMSPSGGASNLASNNLGVGAHSLEALTTGRYNMALGGYAAYRITTGIFNIALGAVALGSNLGGNNNVAVGEQALYSTTGNNNVGIGRACGWIGTGTSRIFIGFQAGFYETLNNRLYIDSLSRASEADGRIKALVYGVFAATTAAQYLTVNGHLIALEDLTTAKVLTPEIKTDTSAPTDLTITTGAAKTLLLATSVFVDLQFPVATGKVTPASGEPSWETFTTNTKEFAFDVNDYIDLQANELFHHWKEGTNGHVHVHCTLKTAQSTGANRFIKFSVWVAYSDTDEVWVEQAVLSAEITIPTGSLALQAFYLDMGDAILTNYLRGGQVKVRVKRIAATGGTEYADDVFVTQVGMHLEINKIGSATEPD